MKNIHAFMLLLVAVAILPGCKNMSTLTRCPDLALHTTAHKPLWAKASTRHTELIHTAGNMQAAQPVNANGPAPVAKTAGIMPIKIVLPRQLEKSLSTDEQFEEVNKVFDNYSNHQVHISRNAKGRTVFTATSFAEVMKLTKAISAAPAASAAPGEHGGLAIAGGILGIIALVLALGPYVGYASFGLGILAIIFGAIGLRSSRHGWAVLGIVLGVLALVIGAALTGVYVVVLHI